MHSVCAEIMKVTLGRTLEWKGRVYRCALGAAGVRVAKREGDMATPEGCFPLRRLLYRPDRESAPESGLPAAAIERDDGWCDDPVDPFYNRPVTLPYPARAEALWRDDRLYDLLIVLGHNDDPVRPGAGSAIFLHLAAGDFESTEGCVALKRSDFLEIVKSCDTETKLCVVGR